MFFYKSCDNREYILLSHQQCSWKDIDEYVVTLTDANSKFTTRVLNCYCTLCARKKNEKRQGITNSFCNDVIIL